MPSVSTPKKVDKLYRKGKLDRAACCYRRSAELVLDGVEIGDIIDSHKCQESVRLMLQAVTIWQNFGSTDTTKLDVAIENLSNHLCRLDTLKADLILKFPICLRLAKICLDREKPKEAIECLAKRVEVFSCEDSVPKDDFQFALRLLAEAYSKDERIKKAVKVAQRCLQTMDKEDQSYVDLFGIYCDMD